MGPSTPAMSFDLAASTVPPTSLPSVATVYATQAQDEPAELHFVAVLAPGPEAAITRVVDSSVELRASAVARAFTEWDSARVNCNKMSVRGFWRLS